MGCAEIIALPEVRARKQWDDLRQQLHARFDQWLDGLEAQLLRSDRSRRSCELRKEFSEIGELHADAQPLIALASQGGHDGRIVTSL